MRAFGVRGLGFLFVAICGALAAAGQAPTGDSYILTLSEAVPLHGAIDRDTRTFPMILIRTSRQYSCLLPLRIYQDVQNTRIRLRIDGIDPGAQVCPAAFGPATASSQVNVSSGTFALEVTAGSQIDHYALSVSDSLLTVAPSAGAFSSFEAAAFRRAPPNSLALSCTLPSPTQAGVCQDFATMLVDSLGAREFTFVPSAQSPFPVQGDQQLDIRYFRYARPEDFGRAYDLLQGFSHRTLARVAPNAWIEVQNWRGVRIDSYRCRADQSQWCTDSLRRPPW